jgi:hypothetical protein
LAWFLENNKPSPLLHVMAGLVPAISIRKGERLHANEITGTRPVMT